MATINVYQQYFQASCMVNGVERRAVAVWLISDSEAGNIRYEVAISFFPHVSDDDFALSYDAYHSRTLYEGKGRRSRKREAAFMEAIRQEADALAEAADASIDWEHPLIEARWG